MFFDTLEKLFGTSHIWWYVAPLGVYLVILYNSLVTVKNNIPKAIANIDVLLKQRHDEIPKLIAACKQYMKFEEATLEKIIRARNGVAQASRSGDMQALGAAEGQLRGCLGQLFALSEAYPDLKADKHFTNLQSRISSLENDIADRRELYNESVNIYNIRIQQLPDVFIAKLLSYQPAQSLHFDASELADIDIDAAFAK